MSTMVVELYEALKEAGASEEKAKAAAVAMANFDSRFNHIDEAIAKPSKSLTGLIIDLKMIQVHLLLSLICMIILLLKTFWPH